MEDADVILVSALTRTGCRIPETVTRLSDFGPEEIISTSLSFLHHMRGSGIVVDNILSLPHSVPQSASERFKLCSNLILEMQRIGFRGELNFHQFLYPSEADTRAILRFFVDKSSEASSRNTTSRRRRRSSQRRTISEKLGTAVVSPLASSPTLPPQTSATPKTQNRRIAEAPAAADQSGDGNGKVRALSLAAEAAQAVKGRRGRGVSGETGEVESVRAQLSAVSANCEMLKAEIARLEEVKERQVSYEAPQEDVNQTRYETRGTDKIRSAAVEVGQIANRGTVVGVDVEEEEEEEEGANEAEMQDLLRELKEEERVTSLAAMALLQGKEEGAGSWSVEEGLARLRRAKEEREEKLVRLKEEWEKLSLSLEERRGAAELSANERRGEEHVATWEQIRELENETKEMQADLTEREKEESELVEALESLPKKSTSRSAYLRRMNDIVRNIRKQDAGIADIVADTRGLQRELNAAQDRLKRAHAVVDELIFRNAKSDPVCRKMYKVLNSIHDDFNELGELVSKTRHVTQEIMDLESKLPMLVKTTKNIDFVKNDIELVKQENQLLEAKLDKVKLQEI